MTSGIKYTHYGLPVVEIDDMEFAIAANEEEADKACYEYIENSIWAFSPFFLEQMTDVPAELFEAVQITKNKKNKCLLLLFTNICSCYIIDL